MAYLIDSKGKRLVMTSTHELYAKEVLKKSLADALKSHVRVAVHKDQMSFETSQAIVTVKQKHTILLIYREHHCRGYASRVGEKVYQSDIRETVKRINFHKCYGR